MGKRDHVIVTRRALKDSHDDLQPSPPVPLIVSASYALLRSKPLTTTFTNTTNLNLQCLEKLAENPSPESPLVQMPPSPNNLDRSRLVSSSQSVVSTVS